MTDDAVFRMLRLPALECDVEARGRLTVVRTSALSGTGIGSVAEWLSGVARGRASA